MARLKKQLRNFWNALQPVLRKPRWWVASVLRRLLWRTTFIAITGSNGKTTTTRYLAAILSSHAPTQWTRLGRNSDGGLTETIAFCKPWKTRYAVFEVAAGKRGAVARSASLVRPDIAVVLSVFLEHRSELKTLETVAREKEDLIRALRPGGVAVLNMDDTLVAGMTVPAGSTLVRAGRSPDNEAWYENAESAWPKLLRFTAVVDGERREIRTRLLGTHWIPALLSCIAVARRLGVPFDQIARVIGQVPPYPGRMQAVRLPSGAVVIRDEFKGSMHTINAAFDEVKKAEAGRKFLVFCDVAETSLSPRKRLERIGRRASELFEFVLFIGDRAHYGVHGALKGGLDDKHTLAFGGYRAAAEFLRPRLGGGDLVLLKANRNNQLPRLFYSLLGEVRCTVTSCKRTMVCDDCTELRSPELVRHVSEQLTVRAH